MKRTTKLHIIQKRFELCAQSHTAALCNTPNRVNRWRNTGDGLQQRVRCAMSFRCFMIVLALLSIADAHIATAFAGDHAIVEPTCGASLPTFTRDASPLEGLLRSWTQIRDRSRAKSR